jgi:heme oxygenase
MNSTDRQLPLVSLRTRVDVAIEGWCSNRLCRALETETVELSAYSGILHEVLFQSYEAPASLALAAVNCSPRFQVARDYLFHHAEEERDHWRWVLDDLSAIGHPGYDLLVDKPPPAAQAYIAFNYYIAIKAPVARLAIGAVLEGIGAKYGAHYGTLLLHQLGLEPNQATFFRSHGETDKKHIEELWEVIETCDVTAEDWRDMEHAAEIAGGLYKAMYDEAATVAARFTTG